MRRQLNLFLIAVPVLANTFPQVAKSFPLAPTHEPNHSESVSEKVSLRMNTRNAIFFVTRQLVSHSQC